MEGFAGGNLEAFEVHLVAAVELEIFFGKIRADDADEPDGRKETGGDGGVAGGAA